MLAKQLKVKTINSGNNFMLFRHKLRFVTKSTRLQIWLVSFLIRILSNKKSDESDCKLSAGIYNLICLKYFSLEEFKEVGC